MFFYNVIMNNVVISLTVYQKFIKFRRNFNNIKKACIPWEMKIKEIESMFNLV